jgi:hypothetical protein
MDADVRVFVEAAVEHSIPGATILGEGWIRIAIADADCAKAGRAL